MEVNENEVTKETTNVKDRKYNTLLGIIIFLFLVIIAVIVAWGLGYIGINKKDSVIKQNTSEQSTSIEGDNTEKEQVNVIEQAYEKYSNLDWETKTEKLEWQPYIENGNIKIKTGDKFKNVAFDFGKPVLTCLVSGQAFNGIAVVNDKGEVYISNVQYDFLTSESSTLYFSKKGFGEKVIDIAYGTSQGLFPYSGPYFMTESGKVYNKDYLTYEEINRDHIDGLGPYNAAYICKDDTIEIDKGGYNYAKATDKSGNEIKVDKAFHWFDLAENADAIYVISKDKNIYSLMFIGTENPNLTLLPKNTSKVSNVSYEKIEYNTNIKVTLEDGTVLKYDNVVDTYNIN